MMANLSSLQSLDLAPYMEQIELVDSQNIVRFRPAGRHVIQPIQGMTYISFYAVRWQS